jgi:hypothetical protein
MYKSLGGPKISSKKNWRAKNQFKKELAGQKETFLGGNVYNYNNYFQEKYLPGHSKSHGGPNMARGPHVGHPWVR